MIHLKMLSGRYNNVVISDVQISQPFIILSLASMVNLAFTLEKERLQFESIKLELD